MFGSFFGSKPLSPLFEKIEAATNSPLSQPDEAAFLEICDYINQDINGPATALTALINQLEQFAARDPKSAAFTLTLLDFCVKNGGYRFTSELCKGNYLQRLKKLVDRKDIAVGIRNRLLALIKVWAQAFSDHVDFQPVNALYRELLRNSVHFPDVDINDVDLLKRAIPSPNIFETPRLSQQPTAPNVQTMHLMGAIRNDLHLTYLDLPAFEALLQGLACNPPDSVTLRQLQTTADRLEGLQRRLEAYIVPLSDSTDPKSENAQEVEAALDELIRVNERIRDGIQQFQSFERMLCREKEESQKAAGSISGTAASEAAAAPVAKPPSAPKPLPETVVPSPATTSAAVKTRPSIQRTLFQAREAIQQFRTFQLEQRVFSAQLVNAAQMEDLRAVGERLEDLQKKVSELINDFLSGNSTDIIEEDEIVLANLTSVNDDLLRCVETYQRTVQRDEKTRRETTEPLSSAETTTAIGAVQATMTPTASSSTSPPLSSSSTTTATPSSSSRSSASTSSSSSSSSSSSTTTASSSTSASSSTTTTSTTTTSTRTEASSSSAVPAAGTHLAEAQQCLRKNIQSTLDQAMETLAHFAELLQGCVERPLQPADPTRVAEFQHVGDRLGVLQKKIPPLIKSWSEILGEDSVNVLEGDEAILDTLTRVNDELLHGIEKYEQAVERLDRPRDKLQSGAVAGGQEWMAANGPASGRGTVPGRGHSAFEAAQSVISGQSTFPDAQMADQPGAVAGGQGWTTANGPASRTGAVPGSGHAAFGAVTEAAQSVTSGQSTFPDAQMADQFATLTTQNPPSEEVRDLRKAIVPVLEHLQSAYFEFVTLLDERSQRHRSQITPQLVTQMQELVSSMRENRQHLSDLANKLQDAISAVKPPDYVDPMLTEIINATTSADEALRRFDRLCQQTGTYFQEEVSSSAPDGQEFRHDGSGDLRHGDNGSINAESEIFRV